MNSQTIEKKRSKLFPGLEKVVNALSLHTKEYLKNPPFKIFAFLSFIFILGMQYHFLCKYYYLIEPFVLSYPKTAFFTIAYFPALLLYISVCYMYQILYNNKFEFFEKYKGSESPWPWENSSIDWKSYRNALLTRNFINTCIITPLWVCFAILTGAHLTYLWKTFELPSLTTFCLHIIWMLLMEDLGFFIGHWTLHRPSLYPYIHKIHHMSIDTIHCSAQSSHPIEHIFSNLIPTTLGAILMPGHIHIVTVVIFLAYRVFETVDGHSGYEIPWSYCRWVPFGGTSNYHSYHHLVNIGNYGSQLIIWDSIFGTNKDYFKYVEDNVDKTDAIKLKSL